MSAESHTCVRGRKWREKTVRLSRESRIEPKEMGDDWCSPIIRVSQLLQSADCSDVAGPAYRRASLLAGLGPASVAFGHPFRSRRTAKRMDVASRISGIQSRAYDLSADSVHRDLVLRATAHAQP